MTIFHGKLLPEFEITIYVTYSAILRPSHDRLVVSGRRNWSALQKTPPDHQVTGRIYTQALVKDC